MARTESRVDKTIDIVATTAGLLFLAFSVVGVVVYIEALIWLDFLVPYTIGLALVGGVVWLWRRREHRWREPATRTSEPARRTVSIGR